MIREYKLLEGATFPDEVAKRVSAKLSDQVPELLVVTGEILPDELSVRRGKAANRQFSLAQVAVFDDTVTAQDTFTRSWVKIMHRDGMFVIEEASE